MVINLNKHIVLGIVLLSTFAAFAQGHLSSSVSINKSSVYVGEPVQVTVSVFTSTWFTKGVDPGNIKVNGAFTVYFRSLSTSKQIKGKTHAGVQLFFNVFPHENENIEFPELNIEVESPNPGDYKGVKHIIRTRARTIKVKPIPPNFDADNWLVTSWMSASENWNGNLKNVQVGDVLERTIYRNVSNTVSELIPSIKWDTIRNVSQYPKRSSVKNNKTKTEISATRTEGTRYLFEKEGRVIIPKMELTWYNPYRKKLYKKTLPEVSINVQPNPDLGMLTSIKKDLDATIIEDVDTNKKPFHFFGLSFKEFLVLAVLSLLFLFYFIKLIIKVARKIKQKKQAYMGSESYHFDKLLKSIRLNNRKIILKNLYNWVDSLNLKEPTISYLLTNFGLPSKSTINEFIESVNAGKISKSELKSLRKNYQKPTTASSTTWINP